MINNFKYGLFSFRLGIFLLPSAPIISALFFLISISFSLLIRKDFLKDKWNYTFIIAAFLMICITIYQTLNFENLSISIPNLEFDGEKEKEINWTPSYSILGLSNWLPLLLCYWGFQQYLLTSDQRKIATKFFVAGSIPVLVSGFGQYWFGWYGPLETLNGWIIWFQRDEGKVFTSVFNNQNYAGSWLNIVWPLSIAIFFDNTKNIFKKGSSLFFMISIFIASFLTTSRNAWGGLLLSVPLVLGPLSFYWVLPLFFLLFLLIFFKIINFFPENVNTMIDAILPPQLNIFNEFEPSNYPEKLHNRYTIFLFAISLIIKNPLIGFGAASFPIYYFMKNNIFMNHTHNLIIEFAFNYGLVVAILIFTNIFLLCFFAIKQIYFSNSKKDLSDIFYERAWLTSFIVLFSSQMFDVQYYDGRISLTFWILLSGIRCIISENKNEQEISH